MKSGEDIIERLKEKKGINQKIFYRKSKKNKGKRARSRKRRRGKK